MQKEYKIKPDWQPSATLEALQQRANLLRLTRDFFAERDVLEVDTPLLCQAGGSDPYIQPMVCDVNDNGQTQRRYLQTSPEYAMKRLLAAGSGSIYQLCKAFRCDEVGASHNPEFTMLEWYRVGYDYQQLMAEMDEYLQQLLQRGPAQYLTYQTLFLEYLAIDPHHATLAELIAKGESSGLDNFAQLVQGDLDTALQLLMSHLIEPRLAAHTVPLFIYDFPAAQVALARIRPDDVAVAERFEVYVNGIELANGFQELTDANEQRQRFVANNQQRRQLGYPEIPLDERFLSALAKGLPDCSGVALGFDRLVMLATKSTQLADNLSFAWRRA